MIAWVILTWLIVDWDIVLMKLQPPLYIPKRYKPRCTATPFQLAVLPQSFLALSHIQLLQFYFFLFRSLQQLTIWYHHVSITRLIMLFQALFVVPVYRLFRKPPDLIVSIHGTNWSMEQKQPV